MTKNDVPEFVWNRLSKADTNHDGSVTKDELDSRFKDLRNQRHSRPSDAKPAEKPKDEKPAEVKPQNQTGGIDVPADATAVANAGD